jgi:uncharacterized protein YjbJ (UPF0337 family)
MAINGPELQRQWHEVRSKVKEKWGHLTDDDLKVEGGNFDQLIGRIQKKTGEGREAIERFLNGLTSDGSAAIACAADTAREYAEHAGEQLQEGYRRAESIVRHRPASSVVTAFGIGIVVGVALVLAVRQR